MQPIEAKRILEFLYQQVIAVPAVCHDNQVELSAFVDAELDGRSAVTLFPDLHRQLAACESCRKMYVEIKTLLGMERLGTLAIPPMPANFDFSYLAYVPQRVPLATELISITPISITRVVDHITWQLTGLGQLIATLSEEFIRSLQPVAPQNAFLKSAGSTLFAMSSPDIADDLKVTITAREKRREPEYCTITVHAEIPSRGGWPNLSEIAVTLSVAGQAVETASTDDYGMATFPAVRRKDLGQLAISVNPT